jgi:hypothetical protein
MRDKPNMQSMLTLMHARALKPKTRTVRNVCIDAFVQSPDVYREIARMFTTDEDWMRLFMKHRKR